ncbi:MAG: NigD-like protein [Prevotellaceae bacterium]|jgi:hypothetical protein|nr:NigD-like protein [Prevotellaceae bacterium]
MNTSAKIAPQKSLAYVAALCFSAVLSSCSLDGSYEQFSLQTELAVVKYNTPDGSSWYILNDDGLKLWPKNASEVKLPEDSARVLVVFNVLFDEEKPGYNYVIAIISQVLSIDVYDVTAADSATASAPSDLLEHIGGVWIGSRYLNVDYYFFSGAAPEKHTVSLLCDTAALQSGGEVKLLLKHANNGDEGTQKVLQNIVSFDLESLRSVVKADSIDIAFEAKCSSGGTYQRDLTYKFGD